MPFQALELSLAAIRLLRPLMGRIRRFSVRLHDQLVDSANSAAANLAEGSGRTSKDQDRFYRTARGSANESHVHLRAAEAWGVLTASDIAPAADAYDHLARMITNMLK